MVIPKIVELEKQIIQFLQVNSFIFIDFYLLRNQRTYNTRRILIRNFEWSVDFFSLPKPAQCYLVKHQFLLFTNCSLSVKILQNYLNTQRISNKFLRFISQEKDQ